MTNTVTSPSVLEGPRDYSMRNPHEVVAAAGDFFAHVLGTANVGRHLHPLARELRLSEVVYAYGVLSNPRPTVFNDARALISRGLKSEDLRRILQTEADAILFAIFQAAASYRAWSPALEVKDFTAQRIEMFSMGGDLELFGEGAEIVKTRAFDQDSPLIIEQLRSYGRIFTIPGNWIMGDDVAGLRLLMEAAATLPAATESRLLAQLLATTPTLEDGALFDSTNTVSKALDVDAFAEAVGLLRKQGQGGQALNLAARHLVVEPELEVIARKVVHDADMSDLVTVDVLPDLADGGWFVFGDTDVMAPVRRMRLENIPAARVDVGSCLEVAGLQLRVILHTQPVFTGRVGFGEGARMMTREESDLKALRIWLRKEHTDAATGRQISIRRGYSKEAIYRLSRRVWSAAAALAMMDEFEAEREVAKS